MLHKSEVDKYKIAEVGVRDVRSVLRGDLPDATLCLLLVKLSVNPSKRFAKLVVRPVNRKSRSLKEGVEEAQSE